MTDRAERCWNTQVAFTAISRQQVIAASESEAEQIAIGSVKSRSFTEAVKVTLSKAWPAGDRHWPDERDHGPLCSPPKDCYCGAISPRFSPTPSSGDTAEMTERRRPSNAQQEPPFPDEETVAMSIRYPMMTCHLPTERCAIQEPHQSKDCGEFGASPTPSADTPLGELLDAWCELVEEGEMDAQGETHAEREKDHLDWAEREYAARSAIESAFRKLEAEQERLRAHGITVWENGRREIDALSLENQRLREQFSIDELAQLCTATDRGSIGQGVISRDLRAKLVQMWNEANRRSLSSPETPRK